MISNSKDKKIKFVLVGGGNGIAYRFDINAFEVGFHLQTSLTKQKDAEKHTERIGMDKLISFTCIIEENNLVCPPSLMRFQAVSVCFWFARRPDPGRKRKSKTHAPEPSRLAWLKLSTSRRAMWWHDACPQHSMRSCRLFWSETRVFAMSSHLALLFQLLCWIVCSPPIKTWYLKLNELFRVSSKTLIKTINISSNDILKDL